MYPAVADGCFATISRQPTVDARPVFNASTIAKLGDGKTAS